eukprot:5595156-Pleurochrysis_carterae.AAC.1
MGWRESWSRGNELRGWSRSDIREDNWRGEVERGLDLQMRSWASTKDKWRPKRDEGECHEGVSVMRSEVVARACGCATVKVCVSDETIAAGSTAYFTPVDAAAARTSRCFASCMLQHNRSSTCDGATAS